MDSAVITERFLEKIAGRTVEAALFTTYTFDRDFFELDVIPLLLGQDISYSTDERVKRFMVREKLRLAEIPIDVYYDLPAFRDYGHVSPDMEYLFNGVLLKNNFAFHGKVSMILVKDKNCNSQSLLLSAGSNNLTRAGWWDNIECQHWEEIGTDSVHPMLLEAIKQDIKFLTEHIEIPSIGELSAVRQIEKFLLTCKSNGGERPVYYFGLKTSEKHEKHGAFFEFLKQDSSPLTRHEDWRLEIVSPYFADNVKNDDHHQKFLDVGVKEIRIFLPINIEGEALCKSEYYDNILSEKSVNWANWSDEILSSLEMEKDHYRRIHAKLFHFFNEHESWVFVGSINFTHNALYKNVEAGFLVQLDKPKALLGLRTDEVENFSESEEPEPGNLGRNKNYKDLPELHLCFDWKKKQLVGRTSPYYKYEIEILDTKDCAVIDSWQLNSIKSEYSGSTANLEDLLRNGSLVKVQGRNIRKKSKPSFPAHRIVLQQVEWSHKPLNHMPQLTANQILAIYSEISTERRQLLLFNEKVRELIGRAQGGELFSPNDNQQDYQFFCEYAEIFSAFSKLRKLFVQASDNQVDYYLTGAGVDSLPSLIQTVLRKDEKSEKLSTVTRYLILLCVLEVYKNPEFCKRANVQQNLEILHKEIYRMKNDKVLKLEENTNRERFFNWFENEFSYPYTPTEQNE